LWLAEHTNSQGATGQLAEVLDGTDVFIGVSAPNLLSGDELIAMAEDPIVFALVDALTVEMQLAAAAAITDQVGETLSADEVVPSVFDERLVPAIAAAIRQAAV